MCQISGGLRYSQYVRVDYNPNKQQTCPKRQKTVSVFGTWLEIQGSEFQT